MKRILFSSTFFATDTSGNSKPQFEAGKHYPPDDAEARRCIARGIAAEVDVEDEQPAAAADAPADAAAGAEAAAVVVEPVAADSKPSKAKK